MYRKFIHNDVIIDNYWCKYILSFQLNSLHVIIYNILYTIINHVHQTFFLSFTAIPENDTRKRYPKTKYIHNLNKLFPRNNNHLTLFLVVRNVPVSLQGHESSSDLWIDRCACAFRLHRLLLLFKFRCHSSDKDKSHRWS